MSVSLFSKAALAKLLTLGTAGEAVTPTEPNLNPRGVEGVFSGALGGTASTLGEAVTIFGSVLTELDNAAAAAGTALVVSIGFGFSSGTASNFSIVGVDC